MAWYEDFLITNARAFAEEGITAVKVQDETREPALAAPRTIARMAALCRVLRAELPRLRVGVIVQAHDAETPLVVAEAAGAEFVRLKVFVGAAVNADGLREALAPRAGAVREVLGRSDLAIYADVHDRTAVPAAPVSDVMAALWAQGAGADALVITGRDFADTLYRIRAARGAGVVRPVIVGGGVSESNVEAALAEADSVVVSTSLLRDDAPPDAIERWDRLRIARFSAAARRARPEI